LAGDQRRLGCGGEVKAETHDVIHYRPLISRTTSAG
jgi:hypothetical protein